MAESLEGFERGAQAENRELAVLHNLSLALSRSHDTDELLATGMDLLLRLLDLPAGNVHEVLWEEGRLRLRIGRGLSAGAITYLQEVPLEGTYAGDAARTGRTVIVPDLTQAPRLSLHRDLFQQEGFRGLACVPIIIKERVWGVLAVVGKETRAFSPAEIQVLEAVSGQFGIALERALLVSKLAGSNTQLRVLLEAAEAGKRRLESLTRVARSVTTTLHPAEVFRAVVQAVVDLFPGNRCSLWVVNGESLECRAEAGASAPMEPKPIFRFGEGLVGVVAATRSPLIVADVSEDSRVVYRERIKREGSVSYLGLPLMAGDRVQGVLELFMRSAHHFLPEEVALLESFASQAVVAIDNARLFQEAVKHAARAETLVQLNQAVSASLRPRQVLETVRQATVRLFNAFRVAVWVADEERRVLSLWTRPPTGPLNQQIPVQRHFGDGGVGWVAEHRAPILFASIQADERLSPADRVHNQGFSSFTAIPIQLERRLLGVLSFTTTTFRQMPPEERALLDSLAGQAATALENARLYEAERTRQKELNAVRKVGQEVSTELELEPLLHLIVRRAVELAGVSSGIVYTLEEEVLVPRAWWNLGPWLAEVRFRLGQGIPGIVAQSGEAMIVNDYLNSPYVNPLFKEHSTVTALIAMPLISKGKVVGVITINNSTTDRRFSEADQALLSLFAPQAASAIENARLYEEAQKRARELQGLIRAGQTVSSSLEPRAVLETIVREAALVMRVDTSTLRLLDPTGERLVWTAEVGIPAEWREETPRRVGEGLAGWVVAEGRPLAVLDPLSDPRTRHRSIWEQFGLASYLGVPIKEGDRTIGVLSFYAPEPRRFTEEEIALALSFADQAAIALKNARLFQESRRAYEELAIAQEQLVRVEKLRAMGEMASGVAHDFNNVLAAILGRVQLLLQRIEDPELRRSLTVIEQAALDGAQTVRRIQEFTRVRREQSFTSIDLVEVIRDALEVTQPRWRDEPQSRGIVVRVETKLAPLPPVPGNPAELREVLTNLILNALDAMPNGGTLTLTSRADERGVIIEVQDTGIGMTDEVRRRIFDPFFTTKGPKGTGLGLAVVYGIVTRHGGEIQVESREGVGSTFTIRLPYGLIESPPTPEKEFTLAAPARVLVIDDEEAVREALRDILSLRHVVEEAASGAEGIDRLKQTRFDLVITDLGMAGMSGWQVAQAVKALRPETAVVLVTGWGVQLDPAELRAKGVDRVLPKPFEMMDVFELVASVVDTNGMEGE